MYYTRMGQVLLFLCNFSTRLKIYNCYNKTLKLSAVLLAPAGTVYRLLGNQGSRHEKQNIRLLLNLIIRRVLIDSRLEAFLQYVRLSRIERQEGIPHGGRHLNFPLDALSWRSSEYRSGLSLR